MSWCPKCKNEYENDVKICAECHMELVDYLEVEGDEDITKLCNVASLQEAHMIKSLLDAYGIPVLSKSKGSGDYLQIIAGTNYQGVDIYVPASSLNEAIKIINEDIAGEDEEGEVDVEAVQLNELNTKIKSRGRFVVWLLFIFFLIIPVVIGFIISVVRYGM